MQTFISSFTNIMSLLVLGLPLASVALFGSEAWRLRQGQRRAFVGLVSMLVVIIATAASLIVLTARTSPGHHSPFLSQWLLPFAASVLLAVLYRLSFPPSRGCPFSRRAHFNTLVLLSIGAALSTSGLAVLDFLFS